MQKTYQSIRYKELHHSIVVNGVRMTVDFDGGTTFPRVINGTYQTENKDIQDALERSDSFNKLYKLLYSDGVSTTSDDEDIDEQKRLEIENAELKASIEAMKLKGVQEAAKQPVKETVNVPGVFNLQQARDYLVKEFGLNKKSLINPVSIKKRAEENNIVFTDFDFE